MLTVELKGRNRKSNNELCLIPAINYRVISTMTITMTAFVKSGESLTGTTFLLK